MAIDPRIAMGFQSPDIAGALARGQELQENRYKMDRQRAADKREDELRTALGDILTGNGSFSQPAVAGAPGAAMPPKPSMQPSAQERAARADPEKYLEFQGRQTEVTAKQLKGYRDLNDTAMQILGGVNDQGSYDRAKAAAKVLYRRYGHDPAEIDALPPEYSPDVVRSLQMQGMDTAHQLHQVAVENKLNWDEYDDQQDNDRADRQADSLSHYRDESLDVRRRGQDLTDSRVRRGQDLRGGGSKSGGAAPKTEGAVYADIAHRWLNGQPISPRETRFAKEYEARHTPKGRSVSAGDGAIIKNPKTGQRMKLQGGKWVPIP
jgi:hypothetical protein